MKTINGMSVERYLAAQLLSNSSLKGKKYYDKEDEYTSIIEQNKHLFTEKDDIVRYESNTKGKEAFVKEVLTPVVQQYGYSVASYTGEDGKDEKVWLFKRSNRKIGLIDDAQFAVDNRTVRRRTQTYRSNSRNTLSKNLNNGVSRLYPKRHREFS